jgi:thymidylate synthase ThyX
VAHAVCAHTFSETCSYNAFVAWLLDGMEAPVARHVWLKGRYIALSLALIADVLPGVHKQLANRILMPWTMTTLVMTAVDTWWEHFISLRDHYMAQDEVQEAAALFTTLYVMSAPDLLAEGDWHLPFVTEAERYTVA